MRACFVLCFIALLAGGGCKAARSNPASSSDAGPSASAGAEASGASATPENPSAAGGGDQHGSARAGEGGQANAAAASSSGDDPGAGRMREDDAGAAGTRTAISLEDAMKRYLSWTPRQDAPRAISAEIFSLCRLPTLPEQAFTESVHGGSLALRDWANDLAVAGLKAGTGAFPVGAAIVKQKLMGSEVIALGLMVKQAAGYDTKHGDWAFGYWERQSGLSSGAEPARACGDCHAGAKTDFVFVDQSWRMP